MKIILSGADGKMGKVISDLVSSGGCDEITAGFSDNKITDFAYPVFNNLEEAASVPESDVLIDFSSPSALPFVLGFCLKRSVPAVIATTGFNEKEEKEIEKAAKTIPILHSGNMSLGINIMEMLATQLAAKLKDFDIEIIEKHHRYKKDAPSGTAKMLFEAAKSGRGSDMKSVCGRSGIGNGRSKNEIGISSVRGGNIVGEHELIFAGDDEILEIKHIANSRKIFASGAIAAARFLLGQKPGLYSMSDMLGAAE